MTNRALASGGAGCLFGYLGVFGLCLGTLLYEVTLTRVFSFVTWSHFAFLIVSTALFGFGLAGVWLSIGRDKNWRLDDRLVPWLCGGFSLGAVLSLVVIRYLPLAIADLDHLDQWLNLFAVYLSLILPFFCAGLAIAILLSGEATRVHRLYFCDLMGAALGSVLIVLVITPLGATGSLLLAAGLGAMGGVLFAWPRGGASRLALALLAVALLAAAPLGEKAFPLVSHTTKRLTQADIDSRVMISRWSILSRIDVTRHEDGSPHVLYINGGENESGFGHFTRGEKAQFKWNMVQTAPYLWLNPKVRGVEPKVCIIGSSGGAEVVFALGHGASEVDAVEMDPMIVELLRADLREWNDGLYDLPNVHLVLNEGRAFIAHSDQQYDLIQMINNHTPIAIASGAINLSETYLLTVEGMKDYIRHLSPEGVLSIQRWGMPRLLTILRQAGQELGLGDLSRHVLVVKRTRMHSNFFFSKKPFTAQEIELFKQWAAQYGREIVYEPGMDPGANIMAILLHAPDPSQYYDYVGFDISPPTDNRPFFDHMILIGQGVDLKHWLTTEGMRAWTEVSLWRPLDGFWGALDKFPIPKGEVPLMAIALQSILISLVLIYLPLRFFGQKKDYGASRWPLLSYFSILGMAFIMIELCYIKQYILYLGYPAISIALVIASLLLFTGVGSFISEFFGERPFQALKVVMPGIFVVNLAMLGITDLVFRATLGWTMGARVVVAMLLIAPMGLLMGMPFPLGLRILHRISPNLVGWAWGVNGFMTVVGSILTIFVAVFFGFHVVLFIAGTLYLLGSVVAARLARQAG